MTPEGKVKKEIKAYLTSVGAWWDMPVRNGFGRSGVPDIVGCYKGYFFALEVKAGDNKPTKWQERELDAIVAAGGAAVVAWSVEHAQQVIAYIEQRQLERDSA